MEKRSYLIITGQFLIALTIIMSTLIASNTLKTIKLGSGKITVKGCAEKEIQSDFVKWQGSINATADTQLEAYEKLENSLKVLSDYIQNNGINLNAVGFSPITTSTNYKMNENGHATNQVDSYVLSQEFVVESSDVKLITHIAQDITTLIKEGISISSYAPQYFYLKIDELKIAMLGEAAKDARLRAEELVHQTASRVGKLRNAQQGVFQITPAYSTSVSDYGEYDTTSIAKKIKAIVTMEYGIE